APMGEALRETSACAREIIALEADFDLEVTTPLDMGLVLPMFHWASGLGLDIVLADTYLAAGDFVRWARQVLDLLDQVALVAPPRGKRWTGSGAAWWPKEPSIDSSQRDDP